jgi:RNA polymerase sigma-70 factor (ECF subfamily)
LALWIDYILSAFRLFEQAKGMDPTSELVRRCIEGDPAAFERLVRDHMNTVLGLAYNYVGNFSAAEDIAQETFVQAFQSLTSLRDSKRFKVWLLKIARNKSIDAIRRSPHWVSLDQDKQLQREIALKPVAAPKDLAFEFTEDDLLTALRSLRQDYREIFVMKHIDNFSYKEISQILGMTVSAVGEKLYRVRSMIRDKLEDMKFGSHGS